MIDMAEAKETKEETKKDEVTGDTLVWSEAERKYVNKTMSPELYKQQKKAQTRQAAIAGATGLAAEGLQFAIGQSVFNDPSVRAAQADKARLAAQIKKGPDYLSDAEKSERRQAALAPVERRAEALQRRSEAIAASTGDVSVRSLLASGEAGIAQMRQQALETEAGIAKEDLTRQQLKEQQDEKDRQGIAEVDAMMLELRNKYIREPLHKFIADAGKVTGTLMAYAPAKTIDSQIERLKKLEVPPEKIAEFSKLAGKNPRAARKMFRELIGKKESEDTGETTTEDVAAEAAPAEPVPAMSWKDDATSGKYAGVEYRLGEDDKIRFTSPTTKKEVVVEPGTAAYKSIMDIRPEPQIPEQELTAEQIKEQAVELQESAQLEKRVGETMEEALPRTQAEFLFGEDPLAGGPAERNQKRVKDIYEQTQSGGVLGKDSGPLYKKGSYFYEYDKERSEWTVYTSQMGYATRSPMMTKDGKPVQFGMPEAMNSTNNNVRELYDLAIAEGLVK